ncbi:hypothetical protein MMC27_001536 [Xylographa pallens]|nr:hypothetical protein [Xylographa pallens]
MAPLLTASKAHSSPSLTLIHYETSPNLSNDARLIPRPLSTRASRANLSSNKLQLGKYVPHAISPKEYSQNVVHSYSLDLRPKTEPLQEEREAFYTCTLCFYPLPLKTKPYTPLKPPPWTEDRTGIELVAPPICDHCVDDWEIAEDTASSSKNPRPKEKLRVRTEDLNHASSDLLHEMRKAGHVDCHTSTLKRESTTSRKRSRPEDTFLPEIDLSKRQKNPRLTDVSEKDTSCCDRLITRPTHVSLFKPLELEQSFSPVQSRPLPKWMSQLPSSRVKDSAVQTSSSPVHFPSQREGCSKDDPVAVVKSLKDNVTPLERPWPLNQVSPACSSPAQELSESELRVQRAQSVPERPRVPPKPLAAFPFFQNPRAPLTPAIESSWGSAPSSGMTPYKGLPSATEKKTPSPKGGRQEVLQSNEYNEKYSVQMLQNDSQPDKICPICEETIANSADGDGIDWRRRLVLQDAPGDLVMAFPLQGQHDRLDMGRLFLSVPSDMYGARREADARETETAFEHGRSYGGPVQQARSQLSDAPRTIATFTSCRAADKTGKRRSAYLQKAGLLEESAKSILNTSWSGAVRFVWTCITRHRECPWAE